MKKLIHNRICQCFFILCPFVMGMIFYLHYYAIEKPLTAPFFSALYSSFKLYAFSTDAKRVDTVSGGWFVLLETARFWGLSITGAAFFRILSPFLNDFLTHLKAGRKNSVALHGTAAVAEHLKKSFAGSTVLVNNSSREAFKAKTQIIAFDRDEDTLDFLRKNEQALLAEKETKIYLCLQDGKRLLTNHSAVKNACISQNCARLYWEERYLHRFEANGIRKKNILVIGSGIYAEALLKQAFLVNVFPAGSGDISYHVFNAPAAFLNAFQGLDAFLTVNREEDGKDSLWLHKELDFEMMQSLFADCDRIILAADRDEENYNVFTALCHRFNALPPIDIRLKTSVMMKALYTPGKDSFSSDSVSSLQYHVFGKDEELYTRQIILNDALLARAKEINRWYRKRYDGTAAFELLSTFTQESNIAAADHMPVKLRFLLEKDCSLDAQNLFACKNLLEKKLSNPDFRKKIAETEHERWCRFHYLHGWTYAQNRLDAQKKHDCLLPFHELSEADKEKDLDSYYVLSELSLN